MSTLGVADAPVPAAGRAALTSTPGTAEIVPSGDAEYGGFRVDAMAVALPMAVLREVRLRGDLMPLPCQAPAVVGGLDLRGLVVPVVDLALVLGHPAPAAGRAQVVIVAQQGQVLGIAVDEVTGIFRGDATQTALPVDAVDGGLYVGGIRRADSGEMVSLLSLARLLDQPGLPRVTWPDAVAQRTRAGRRSQRPTLLLRAGRHRLAVDAMRVQTTLDRPALQPSALARGHCLGVVQHRGRMIAALDLSALCGLGPTDPLDLRQAVVIRVPQGDVALLVSEVQDVVVPQADDGAALSPAGLPVPCLFDQALQAGVRWSRHGLVRRADAATDTDNQAPYLMLSSAALDAHEELAALASAHTPAAVGTASTAAAGQALAGRDAGRDAAQAAAQQVLTFMVDEEVAAPLAQVAEILRFVPSSAIFDNGMPLIGLMLDRGRSIPLFCMARLAGRAQPVLDAESCVLAVQRSGQWVGFVVPRLRAIERVQWAPARSAALARSALASALGADRVALVDGAAGQRTLHVVDLQALAARLLNEATGEATEAGQLTTAAAVLAD